MIRARTSVIACMLWPLAACGRIGFGLGDNGNTGEADATLVDAAFDPCAPVTVIPDPLTITGTVIHVTNFDNSHAVVTDATIDVTLGGLPVGTGMTDDNGNYSIDVPSGGAPISIVLEMTSPSFFTSIVYPARPLDHDPQFVTNMFDNGALATVYETAGTNEDGSMGTLIVNAVDCTGASLDGASVAFDPVPEVLAYTGDGSDPFVAGATATLPPADQACAFNEPAGTVAISATYHGVAMSAPTVTVLTSQVTAYAYVEPLSP